ncbi:hypothetical protein JCM10450v2_000620 [Rhodotorula kratochvilovae]
MTTLHCNGFTASLALSTTPLRPLSTAVNPRAPHAVEGVYAVPLVRGQVWTLAWTDARRNKTPVQATVLFQEGDGEATEHPVHEGEPMRVRGTIQTDTPPLKVTLVLKTVSCSANLAVFVLVCGDSSPRSPVASRLPANNVTPAHNSPPEEHWAMTSPHSSPERTLDAFTTPGSMAAGGADDSGMGFDTAELEKIQREHKFYRLASHRLERAMSPASHIRYLSSCLAHEPIDGAGGVRDEAEELTPAARVHTAIVREQMREMLREEGDARVRWEFQNVLRMLVGPGTGR